MNKVYILTAIFSFIFLNTSFSQKDTTEFEIGKKKLLIIDKKTQQENAIYNLEKGKETFNREIKNAEKEIALNKKLLDEAKIELEKSLNLLEKDKEILAKSKENNIAANKNELEEKRIELEQKRIEIEKQRIEVDKLRATINANEKKKNAFESGIIEIEKGIEEIENGIAEMDEELNNIDRETDSIPTHNSKKRKRFNAHVAGFQFGIFNFLNSSHSVANEKDADFVTLVPEKSFCYDLKIFEYNIPLTKYSLGLATGAGIQWNSMSLEKNILLKEDENGVLYAEIIDTSNKTIRKNKFNAVYVTIPVVVEYQVPVKNKKIYFNAGIFGGIRAWSKQKQVYTVDGVKYKDKKLDNFQLSPFRYGFIAGAGYDDFGIFIEYSMIPLFKKSKGPELYPISAGLRLDF